jgi:alpha-N-arabinofuranosidase
LIGAEPFFSVNTTSLQPNEAAQWVEYCNRPKDTFWAERRRKDGFKNPFNVRYWSIGNEQYWLHSAKEYADRYKLWSHWMYNTDPEITLVLSGIEPNVESLKRNPWNTDGTWGEDVLRLTNAGQGFFHGDWHPRMGEGKVLYSIHPYFYAEPECTDGQYYTAFNELDRRLPKSIEATLKLLDKYRGPYPRPRLCFDEYGLIHGGCSMTGNMTQPAPFWAALWLGCFFHICHKYPAEIGMATLPGMINMEHALLLIENGRAVTTPSYHAFKMLRPHGGAQPAKVTVKNKPVGKKLTEGCLRVLASRPEGQKQLTISCINLRLEQALPVEIDIPNVKIKTVRAQLLTGPLHARNSFAHPNKIRPEKIESTIVKGKIIQTLPPHSLAVFDVFYI